MAGMDNMRTQGQFSLKARPEQPIGFASPELPTLNVSIPTNLHQLDPTPPPSYFTSPDTPGLPLEQIAPTPPDVRDPSEPFSASSPDADLRSDWTPDQPLTQMAALEEADLDMLPPPAAEDLVAAPLPHWEQQTAPPQRAIPQAPLTPWVQAAGAQPVPEFPTAPSPQPPPGAQPVPGVHPVPPAHPGVPAAHRAMGDMPAQWQSPASGAVPGTNMSVNNYAAPVNPYYQQNPYPVNPYATGSYYQQPHQNGYGNQVQPYNAEQLLKAADYTVVISLFAGGLFSSWALLTLAIAAGRALFRRSPGWQLIIILATAAWIFAALFWAISDRSLEPVMTLSCVFNWLSLITVMIKARQALDRSR